MDDDNKLHHTLGAIESQLRASNENLQALRVDFRSAEAREQERHANLDERLRKVEGEAVRTHTITVIVSGLVSFLVLAATSFSSLLLRLFHK